MLNVIRPWLSFNSYLQKTEKILPETFLIGKE